MSKYINADTVIQALRETIDKHKDSEMFTRTVRAAENMITIIKRMPSADVVEVKHGHWVKNNRNPEMMRHFHELGIGRNMTENSIFYTCSECGAWGRPTAKFCSECGAQMRERKETNA